MRGIIWLKQKLISRFYIKSKYGKVKTDTDRQQIKNTDKCEKSRLILLKSKGL